MKMKQHLACILMLALCSTTSQIFSSEQDGSDNDKTPPTSPNPYSLDQYFVPQTPTNINDNSEDQNAPATPVAAQGPMNVFTPEAAINRNGDIGYTAALRAAEAEDFENRQKAAKKRGKKRARRRLNIGYESCRSIDLRDHDLDDDSEDEDRYNQRRLANMEYAARYYINEQEVS